MAGDITNVMEPKQIIDMVVNVLDQYGYSHTTRKGELTLTVHRKNEHGFDIVLEIGFRENTLYFNDFHWHFDNSEKEIEDMLDLLLSGLTGTARIKAFSKKGAAYKWTLETQDNDGQWNAQDTMSVIGPGFGNKTEIHYLQNQLI